MSYNKVTIPVIGINLRKLRVQYQGRTVEVDAFPFQLKSEFRPQSITCIVGRDREGRLVLKQTQQDVLEGLYKIGGLYRFKVSEYLIESVSKEKYLQLRDEYGFKHRLYGIEPVMAHRAEGKIIMCCVSAIQDGTLVLISDEYQRGDTDKSAVDISQMMGQEDLALFQKLHEKRLRQFETMNDHSMRGIWSSVVDKYPDSVHFIYELLQNADDAGATEVTIYLDTDRLFFKHNGNIQFTVTDDDDATIIPGHVNALTSIGNSSKGNGNTIGKFGVGFKAVFQYTNNPRVYSDRFKFQIVNYIVPELISSDCPYRESGETLFEIPFINPSGCYKEILAKLNHLKHPILFLNNIQKVKWEDLTQFNHDREYKVSKRESRTTQGVLCERIQEECPEKVNDIWMFTRKVKVPGGKQYPVSVGYFLTYKDGAVLLDTDIRPEVYCFFSTAESFGSCFISQAPFLLVDNRQQVKEHEIINRFFRDAICKLAAEALVLLRDIGEKQGDLIVNENILKIVPLQDPEEQFSKFIGNEHLFMPMKTVLMNNRLLLSRSNTYIGPSKARLAQPVSLMEVLTADQLAELAPNDPGIDFLKNAPTSRDSDAFRYLTDELGIDLFRSEDFARRITPEFMSRRSFEWAVRFYRFLNEDARELWNASSRRFSSGDLLMRKAPIVKLTDGRWVAPYEKDVLNVFFAPENGSKDYNIIADEFFNHEASKRFLIDLGVKEPEMRDYILTKLLPKYEQEKVSIEHSVLRADLDTLIQYSGRVGVDDEQEFFDTIKKSFYVLGRNAENQTFLYHTEQVYYPQKDLRDYFKGFDRCVFLDERFYSSVLKKYPQEKIHDFFMKSGVAYSPRINKIIIPNRYSLTERQKKELPALREYTYHARENGTDWQIDGLENALQSNLTRSLSIQLWKWLSEMNLSDKEFLVFSFFYWKEHPYSISSSLVVTLRETPWVYISQRTKIGAGELTLEGLEMMPEYGYSPQLCELLGIARKQISLEERGADAEQIKMYNRGVEYESRKKELGLTESEAQEALRRFAEDKRRKNEKKIQQKELYDTSDHKEMNEYSADEMFSSGSVRPSPPSAGSGQTGNTLPSSLDYSQQQSIISEIIEDIKRKQQEEIDRQTRQEQLREKVLLSEKYSYVWFKTLLSLECDQEGDNIETFGQKSVSIVFSRVEKDPDSERIYKLKNPSRPIPLEIEQIGGLEVSFSFYDLDDLRLGFEVASVKDFSLRLKAKLSDTELLKGIDWGKCSKAEVQINNSVALVEKLSSAFAELDLPDECNLKEKLTDNISFVFGPPGTGKTTYLAGKICELMTQRECRVLVLSPTNKACDVLTCKVSDMAESTEWLGRFLTTGSERLEDEGLVIDKNSNLYKYERCCIVTTTARLSYDGFGMGYDFDALRDINWDYVILDEASMIPLAQIVYAIYKFKDSRILIAGDPKQIAPIVREEAWKKESIYTMVNLQRFKNPTTEPMQFDIKNLDTQYRSVPQIGRVFSKYAYDGLLKHYRDQESQRSLNIKGFDFLKSVNFITFKVNKHDNICAPRKLSSSNIHIYSVILLVEICKYIAKNYEKGKAKKNDLSVGIICPYAAQAQMINKLLEQCPDIPSCISISVGTIHGFQGDECDVIFAMFNPPRGLVGASDRVLVNDPNIVNVAISRAKDYLFVLMPEKEMYGFEKLYEIIRMGTIVTEDKDSFSLSTADSIEKILFGSIGFIEKNTFVTTHQLANVYSRPASLYEVRIDDNSVDVQISD